MVAQESGGGKRPAISVAFEPFVTASNRRGHTDPHNVMQCIHCLDIKHAMRTVLQEVKDIKLPPRAQAVSGDFLIAMADTFSRVEREITDAGKGVRP